MSYDDTQKHSLPPKRTHAELIELKMKITWMWGIEFVTRKDHDASMAIRDERIKELRALERCTAELALNRITQLEAEIAQYKAMQGADSAKRLADAIQKFRNLPMLGQFVRLRMTPEYVALCNAWDDYKDAAPPSPTIAERKERPKRTPGKSNGHFEAWFEGVEIGDGDIPLPKSGDGKLWDEFVMRHAIALGAWEARGAYEQMLISDIEDPITVPRGLIGAACSAIDKKRPAATVLAKLREYTVGGKSGFDGHDDPLRQQVIATAIKENQDEQ